MEKSDFLKSLEKPIVDENELALWQEKINDFVFRLVALKEVEAMFLEEKARSKGNKLRIIGGVHASLDELLSSGELLNELQNLPPRPGDPSGDKEVSQHRNEMTIAKAIVNFFWDKYDKKDTV